MRKNSLFLQYNKTQIIYLCYDNEFNILSNISDNSLT